MRWLSGLLWFGSGRDRLTERRRLERLSMRVPVRCRRGGALLQGTLYELSAAGLRLELGSQVRSGERLELSPQPHEHGLGRRTVTCQVVWCRRAASGFVAGLRFLSPLAGSWLGHRLEGRQDDQRSSRSERVYRRFPADAPAQVGLTGGLTCFGRLMDLSLGGAQVRVAACPQLGQLVQLKLPGLTLVASVVGCSPVCEDRSLVNLRFLKGQSALGRLRRWLVKLPCAAAPSPCAA